MRDVAETQLDALIDQIRAFVREELYPLEPTLLQHGFKAILPALQEKRRMARELGLWAPFLPPELGGLGLSLPAFARVSEALGSTMIGHYTFNCQAPDVGNMELLLHAGTPEQRERYLRPLAAGAIRSSFAMTEPEHAGSNPVWLSTRAVRDGDDYVISGHKWFTTAFDGCAFTIVMAVTDPDAPKPHQRASMIIVPADAPGLRHVRNIKIMGEAEADWFSHGEIVFEEVRVPRANLIGREGEGFALAQIRLGPGRVHHCMRWIGLCERAFDLLCRRAAERELAPGKPLATRQSVQHWVAECRAEIDAARLMVLDTARTIDAVGAPAARVAISTIKFFVAGVLDRVVDRAIQVHGALGITDDTVLSLIFRHERGARIYDGADEVHKSAVARQIFKGYGLQLPSEG
jgi:alkylation response protein AidB-like acyl-CoA dehydrogenase